MEDSIGGGAPVNVNVKTNRSQESVVEQNSVEEASGEPGASRKVATVDERLSEQADASPKNGALAAAVVN